MKYKDLINEDGSLTERGQDSIGRVRSYIWGIMLNTNIAQEEGGFTPQQLQTIGALIMKMAGEAVSEMKSSEMKGWLKK